MEKYMYNVLDIVSRNPALSVLTLLTGYLVVVFVKNMSGRLFPGPKGLPVLGDLFKVAGGRLDIKLMDLRKRFGDMYMLKLGDMSTLFVFGVDNVQEILVEKADIFTNRPDWLYIPDKIIKKKGIIWTNGEVWQRMRKLLQCAQTSTSCMKTSQRLLLEEIRDAHEFIIKKNGEPFDPSSLFFSSSFNIISSFIFGTRFEDNEDIKLFLRNCMECLTERNKSQNPENMFPKLAFLKQAKHRFAVEKEQEMIDFLKERVRERQSKGQRDHTVADDLIDTYLASLDKDTAENTEINFLRMIIDLYMYGTEMMSSFFLWTVLYLTRYPEIQKKCREELDKVVQSDNPVDLDDKDQLPYCSATQIELLRITGPGIMTAPHTNTEDTTIAGQKIPKGTLVVCDLRLQRKSEEIWDSPEEFRPERFFDISPDSNTMRFSTSTFGIGPRRCPAETLVKNAHFLFLTNTLRQFEIQSKTKDANVTLDSEYKGVSFKPKAFQVTFQKR